MAVFIYVEFAEINRPIEIGLDLSALAMRNDWQSCIFFIIIIIFPYALSFSFKKKKDF